MPRKSTDIPICFSIMNSSDGVTLVSQPTNKVIKKVSQEFFDYMYNEKLIHHYKPAHENIEITDLFLRVEKPVKIEKSWNEREVK